MASGHNGTINLDDFITEASQYTLNADGTITLTSENGTVTINQITTGTGAPTGATPTGNPIYVDVATGDIYTYDGTSWNLQGGSTETTTTLVDNGDGTFTYTSEDSTVTVFDADKTTVTLTDNGDGTSGLIVDGVDIGDVVTSNDYNDLTNLPTLAPSNAEQNVQSDWSETDNTSDSFIANKPVNLSDFTNDAGFITTETDDQTASEVPVDATGFDGNLATTDDDLQKVAQKLDDLTLSQTLQQTLTNGNTYVDGFESWTWNPDILTYLNSDEDWGFELSGETLYFTDGNGNGTGKSFIGYNSIGIGNDTNNGTIVSTLITANRNYNLPDADITFAGAVTDGTTTVQSNNQGVLNISTLLPNTPNLQSVTDEGNTTTNGVIINNPSTSLGSLQVGITTFNQLFGTVNNRNFEIQNPQGDLYLKAGGNSNKIVLGENDTRLEVDNVNEIITATAEIIAEQGITSNFSINILNDSGLSLLNGTNFRTDIKSTNATVNRSLLTPDTDGVLTTAVTDGTTTVQSNNQGVLDISTLLSDTNVTAVDLADARQADGSIRLTSSVTEDGTTVTDTTPVDIPIDNSRITAAALQNTDYGLSRDVNRNVNIAAPLSDIQDANASTSNPTYRSFQKVLTNRAIETVGAAGVMNTDGSLGHYTRVFTDINDALDNNGATYLHVVTDGAANLAIPNGKYAGQILYIDFRGVASSVQGIDNIQGTKRTSPINGRVEFAGTGTTAYPIAGEFYKLLWNAGVWRVHNYSFVLSTANQYYVDASGFATLFNTVGGAASGTTQTIVLPAATTNLNYNIQLSPNDVGDYHWTNKTTTSFDIVRPAGTGTIGDIDWSVTKAILA